MSSPHIIKNFIDRSRELEVLWNIQSEAGAGDAAGIFLSGRNGIGKTELLKQAYYHCFNKQTEAIPFFYTIKTAMTSIENFSKDYFCSFIAQSLAFLKKDISLTNASIYSLEDITDLARGAGVQWLADIAGNFEQARKDGDPLGLFRAAISAPYQSYMITGTPVIVMLDDFHKMRKFCEINAVNNNREFWMLFEAPVNSRYTPHIFTGNQAEMNRMFFEDTVFGEYLELFNLSGLTQDDSAKYFAMLCETYGLDVRIALADFIDLFGGSPYYIKNFVQAARQSSMVLSEDNFWQIYLSEITKGKTFKYWTSLLKTYIPQFDLRKPSLKLLNRLCNDPSNLALSELPGEMSVGKEETEQIMSLLHTSGVIETGFSEFEIADDRVLIDIIRGLYLREIGMQPWNRIKEEIIGDKQRRARPENAPSFSLTIPAAVKAEVVAVKTTEYIARNYNIAPEIIGRLQIALADLLVNVLDDAMKGGENYFLEFRLKENVFSASVTVPHANIVLKDIDRVRIGAYLDGLTAESSAGNTKITFIKEISGTFIPTS